MTDSLKKEYLLLPISNPSLYIELLGQNPTMAITTWKHTHFKTEAPTKSEAVQKIIAMVEEDTSPFKNQIETCIYVHLHMLIL
ncbi:hypothetical protein DYE48_18570 [Halobacillus trueperi]|uniref:Uncharacterized protein n=1 Tax=Halobacillus trueperi TaxID=156205 RepID=A0A3E0J0L1_9BACI|nr:hypothetical protein DYE48_18570 [Halobacillus trueperi]